jgi:hypothetical protein
LPNVKDIVERFGSSVVLTVPHNSHCEVATCHANQLRSVDQKQQRNPDNGYM